MTILWSLARRAVELPEPIKVQFRSGAGFVFLADAIILIPLFIFVQYTMAYMYPILAIIEDEKPPAYGPIAIDENATTTRPDDDDDAADSIEPTARQPRPITSSLRATHRLLNAHGGFRANFRGLSCSLILTCLASFFTLLIPFLRFFAIVSLIANLLLSQLSTALVHIIITPPSPLQFWNRLPSFKRTISVTWKPILLNWSAIQLFRLTIYVATLLLGLNNKQSSSLSWLTALFTSSPLSDKETADMLKCFLLLILSIIMFIFAVLPADVILIRVQASLLPPDHDTIIPFDRSFNGRVEPAVVKGRGFATISDAWATFSRAAWTRLILLQAKIFLTGALTTILAVAFVAPQIYFLIKPVKE